MIVRLRRVSGSPEGMTSPHVVHVTRPGGKGVYPTLTIATDIETDVPSDTAFDAVPFDV